MTKALLVWELGGGLGHAANLLPIARRLVESDHTVALALRDLSVAGRVFGNLQVGLWQAPFKNSRPKQPVPEPRTFADILFNCGFGDLEELRALVKAWLAIYQAARPDVIVAEHSPSALLAARIARCPVVLLGTGFCSPPATGPWPDLRPWSNRPAPHIPSITAKVLANCNSILQQHGGAPMGELPQLFDLAAVCLQSVPQLDPYTRAVGVTYHSAWPRWGGKTPAWPPGAGKRIFGYLKSFPALPQLLALLAELQLPTIVVCDGIDQNLQKRFARPWLLFENEPLDMQQATQQCSVAICNGNHGTTLALLEAGKPALYLPLHLEQTLTAFAVQKLGAGLMASISRPEQIAVRLMRLLEDRRYAETAQQICMYLQQRDSSAGLEAILHAIHVSAHRAL